MSRQSCIAHLRKYVESGSKSILEQAEGERGSQDRKYKELEENLKRARELPEELPEEGAKRIGRMHREYPWAQPPRSKQIEVEAKKE